MKVIVRTYESKETFLLEHEGKTYIYIDRYFQPGLSSSVQIFEAPGIPLEDEDLIEQIKEAIVYDPNEDED